MPSPQDQVVDSRSGGVDPGGGAPELALDSARAIKIPVADLSDKNTHTS